MTRPRIRSGKRRITQACTIALLMLFGAGTSAADDPKDPGKNPKDPKRPTLVLRATPAFAFSPARIVVTAEIRGGSDSDADLYCPDLEWEWDDGTESEASQNCEPFVPGETEITRRWTVSHTYTTAGRYQMYLRLKRAGKVVLAGSTKIEVRPGARDLGEFDP